MKRLERVTRLIFVFIVIYALIFTVTVFAAPSSEGEAISATASNLASQLSEASGSGEKPINWVGVVCWIVIALGILFILYVLLSSGKKRTGVRPKQPMKYRRSPYKKNHRRMQEEYYRYKRNKYR